MTRNITFPVFSIVFVIVSPTAPAAEFVLVTGVDPLLNPGETRLVFPTPGPGFPGELSDGDRLAGTQVLGDAAEFSGVGVPLFEPNAFGALSFTFRRGSIPIPPANRVPILGIDFLGGPLLDLDGDLQNGVRSLVPFANTDPAIIPNSASHIRLDVDLDALTIEFVRMDATGTNVGGQDIDAAIATTINVLAGTGNDGSAGVPINPAIDTRSGVLEAFGGDSGQLTGVYRIESLGYEIWQDSIDPGSSSSAVLGTIQLLGTIRGWLIVRDPLSGLFPSLAGEGLGTTLWPRVNLDPVGQTFVTANGLQGGSATIAVGAPGDDFSACDNQPPGNCNGGLALQDDDGDLGAYFDQVVVPQLSPDMHSFVYLESAGFGINNSFDPVFGDTVGWDVVITAASTCGVSPGVIAGDLDGDLQVDLEDYALFQGCFSGAGADAGDGCATADFDGDTDVDLHDFGAFQAGFGLVVTAPDCLLGG